MTDVIYIANDNVLQLSSLTNGMTAALLGGATVTTTLLTATGAGVTGATGLTMSAVAGATGNYRVTLPYTLSLATGSTYTARIGVTAGALHARWDLPVRATTPAFPWAAPIG